MLSAYSAHSVYQRPKLWGPHLDISARNVKEAQKGMRRSRGVLHEI